MIDRGKEALLFIQFLAFYNKRKKRKKKKENVTSVTKSASNYIYRKAGAVKYVITWEKLEKFLFIRIDDTFFLSLATDCSMIERAITYVARV